MGQSGLSYMSVSRRYIRNAFSGLSAIALSVGAPETAFSAADAATTELAPVPYGPVPYGPVADKLPDAAPLPLPIAIPDSLDRAAAIAATTHPIVEGTEAEAKALESELRAARSGYLPRLSVEALAATSGSSFADQDGFALNATIEQPVWAGGRISGDVARARASLSAGQNGVQDSRRQIALQVVSAYYDLVRATERSQILTDSLRQHRVLLESITRRVDQEVSPLTDLTLGRSRTAQVELELATNEELRETALVRLAELTGGETVEPVLPPSSVVETLPVEDVALNEAMICDPGLAALTDRIVAAEARSDIARAQILPQLLLQLSQNEITGTRAAMVLRLQLGNGVSQLAAIDSSDARVKVALAEFGEAQRRLREQMRRDYIQVRAARARVDAGILASDTADSIIESYKRQFIAGRRTWLDVMNAVREATSARLSESDARVTVAQGSARILSTSCRWMPAIGDEGQ